MPVALPRVELRDSILDAANRLLGRYGYRKMTMDDLATEAGIGKGTIYLCFPSKEEVVLSTIDRLVVQLLMRMTEIASGSADPRTRLHELLVTRVLFRFDHRHHDSQSMDELLSALRPAFLKRRERYFAAEAEKIARVLEDGRKQGVFDVTETATAAHALVLATNSLLPYSLSARELGRRDEVQARAEAIARILLDGLASRNPSAT